MRSSIFLMALAAVLVVSTADVARAEDVDPPVIKHSPLSKATKGDTLNISAVMDDESEIFAPTLYYRYPGQRGYSSVPMPKRGASFVAQVSATADIEYWIEAYDEFGNGPTRDGTPDRPHLVTVAERVARQPSVEPAPAPVVVAPVTPEPANEPVAVAEPAPQPAVDPFRFDPPPPPPPSEPDPFLVQFDQAPKPFYKEVWFIAGASTVGAAIIGITIYALQPDAVNRNTFGASVARPTATP